MHAVPAGMERMTLEQLCARLSDARLPPAAAALRVAGVRDDSRSVEPGDVFVAVRGAAANGAEYIAEAVARGAVAVVAEDDVPAGVPLVGVADARIALAELAAAACGRPAEDLTMVGITGTVGKTSVLAMLAAVLDAAGIAAGTIGSLGVHYDGITEATSNTTPGILGIQQALHAMRAAGTEVAAMEVTSHGLAQRRVHGLSFDLGIFTNLTMLEHLEYHRSFRDYAEVKLRFLDHLAPAAPLLFAAGDRTVRQASRRHGGPRISCGGGSAWVRLHRDALSLEGTRVTLHVRRPLPRLDGFRIEPFELPLSLRTLGRPAIANAALAAAAGLCLGAAPEHVQSALAGIEPPKRRMQVIRADDPIIIDDTVGHPDSISGVFELAERVPHAALRVVYCVRGRRGVQINARDAEALAIWARRVRIDVLHVTSADDTADERNRASAAERAAFLDMLKRHGVPHSHHARVQDAIAAALDGARGRDLVLLLGAQGMDAGADIVRRQIGAAISAGRN